MEPITTTASAFSLKNIAIVSGIVLALCGLTYGVYRWVKSPRKESAKLAA